VLHEHRAAMDCQKGNEMTATSESPSKTQPEVDTRAWQFLLDTSKVSFDAMAVFTSAAVATSTPSSSAPL
jgi:hypothetical protein